MRGKLTLLASVCAGAIAFPAYAQDTTPPADDPAATNDGTEIIVTAQRQNERLQTVPIAVTAFSPEMLERQQIKNVSDLQLTLPNITFTKTNFTGASFTIRGIGDLCVGTTCDSATAIHINDAPVFATRLFEGEFYDLAQVEVLRGPQGTLFGRNATSGVVDFITAKPDLTGIHASGEAEYGNYNGIKTKGMINLPIGDSIGVRVAGFYLNRDGYTKNLFNNTRVDDRDEYGVRGSLRIEPTSTTRIDLMGQFFHERDNRLRIQKQLCQRDPTGVLGCLNATLPYETTNGNTTFVGVLTSKEFFATQGIPPALGLALGSIYGPDAYTGVVNPADPRVISSDTNPTYFSEETILQGSIDQELGSGLDLKLQGNYQHVKVDSSQDYNNSVQSRALIQPALNSLAAGAAGAFAGFGLPAAIFTPVASRLIPNGPAGVICTSLPEETGTGVYGGHSTCSMTPQDFDRSANFDRSYSAEAILSSKWDGMFNFLLGGIYANFHNSENSYYVDAFGIDYFTGLFGSLQSGGAGYLGTPTYRNNTADLRIKSYGIFGETYFKFNDQLKLTLGLRYNHDEKSVSARTTLASFIVPFGSANAYATPLGAGFDADPSTTCSTPGAGVAGTIGSKPGCEGFQVNTVSYGRVTGRAVLDYQIDRDHLLYASYSRGYKSGGINPPLSPVFSVPVTFAPESVNAFEVGSKNQFGGLTLNLTGFYYQYKGLQLSRIVARTSVNDNVNANIYGLEAEAVMHPVREMTVNLSASYLHTRVSSDKFLSNPRDFGAGRADAVIIKDITNGANCAVASNSGNVAGVNGFVNTVNGFINAGAVPGLKAGAGLQGTTPFPANGGIASTGAFSVCGALTAAASGAFGAALNPATFGGVTVFSSGIPVNIKGNELPGAPNFKVSMGVQYEFPIGNWTFTPRFDAILTGDSTGNIFNGNVNRIPSYTQYNAQVQLDGPDKRYFIRGFIQNIENSNAITGLYVTDQSSGNYTNIFTLEPRRYGVAAGFRF